MILALQNLELRFQNSHPARLLPPAWQIIYQEGIRGNHILFKDKDIELFIKNQDFEGPIDETEIEELGLRIVAASSIPEMKQLIETATFANRRQIFFIYRVLLTRWTDYLKKKLH